VAGAAQDDDDIISSINVTPLVDIVLVLLIIFMVTTQVVAESERPRVIPVDMPSAASAEEMLSKGMLDLVINKEGILYINGEKSDQAGLKSSIDKIKENKVTPQALISADRDVPHGEVAQLMDYLRINKVFQVAINTKKQRID
jgi:biopolymer transport protein ExbD